MRVTISAHARRRGITLAQYLSEHGHLHRLITAYPGFKMAELAPTLHPRVSVSGAFLAERVLARLGRDDVAAKLTYPFTEWYDLWVSRNLAGSEIVHSWSGFFLRALRRARELGAMTVVDRASAHIEVQRELLREEHERLNLPGKFQFPDRVLDKELCEYEEADVIAVPGMFVRESFLAQGVPEDKLLQVPYGTDLSQFGPAPKKDDVFRIMHCGAMDYQKGVHYLLQAFGELDLPNAELWLVGPRGPFIEGWLERWGTPNVRLLGPFPQSELRDYYTQSSVLCICSVQDGWPLVTGQAMACGLPVICSTNAGSRDMLREGIDGFIVPVRDVEALKEKILWCYEHQDETREMGRSAAEQVKQAYTWDDYCARMVAEYERLLAGRS